MIFFFKKILSLLYLYLLIIIYEVKKVNMTKAKSIYGNGERKGVLMLFFCIN